MTFSGGEGLALSAEISIGQGRSAGSCAADILHGGAIFGFSADEFLRLHWLFFDSLVWHMRDSSSVAHQGYGVRISDGC